MHVLYGVSEDRVCLLTLRSPEILAPARMPVAEGKKMENIPKKLPSMPLQSGTKF